MLITIIMLLMITGCPEPPSGTEGMSLGEVSDIIIKAGDGTLELSWKNPADSDFSTVKILYKIEGGAESEYSGNIDNSGTAISGLLNSSIYLITIKTIDTNSNVSEGLTVKAVPSVGVREFFPGYGLTFALMNDGTLLGLGTNQYGQMGDGTVTTVETVKEIANNVKSVSTREFVTMVLKEDGTLWSAGQNGHGQLGDGTKTNISTLKKVAEDVNFVTTSGTHTMIIKTDNSLWGVGENDQGGLGDGTHDVYADKTNFVKIMEDVKSVATGLQTSFILKSDGTLWVTGSNSSGMLGDPSISPYIWNPQQLMSNVIQVSTGLFHSMILKNDGTLWSAGQNAYGAMGSPDTDSTNKITTHIQIMSDIASVSCSDRDNTFMIKTDGSLWGTGSNSEGQLGLDDSVYSPEKIMDDVLSVKACNGKTLIQKKNGTTWGMGLQAYGLLGVTDSNQYEIRTPIQVFW